MSAKSKRKVPDPKQSKGGLKRDIPQFFRLNVEVGNLQSAISFYTTLLGIQGRKQAGSRCYFECGPVTLQVLDVSSSHQPHRAAKALYFTEQSGRRPRTCQTAKVSFAGRRPRRAKRRHRGSSLGGALVLRRRPLEESTMFCRGGNSLRRLGLRVSRWRSDHRLPDAKDRTTGSCEGEDVMNSTRILLLSY